MNNKNQKATKAIRYDRGGIGHTNESFSELVDNSYDFLSTIVNIDERIRILRYEREDNKMNKQKSEDTLTNSIPDTLRKTINFDDLFKLKTPSRDSVLVFNKSKDVHESKEIFRSYMNFLETPEFDSEVKKSYMFVNKSKELPSEFQQFIDFAKSIDPRYNQLSVSWYEKEDFIQPHRDCVSKMIHPDCPILMINLNESDDESKARIMTFENVDSGDMSSVTLFDKTYHLINNNSTHRHGVGVGSERRISLTFRMMKELK